MSLWLLCLLKCLLLFVSIESLVLLNQSNLCEECSCSHEEASLSVDCKFSSSKSRVVSLSGITRPKYSIRLSGHAKLKIRDLRCRSLVISDFESVIFESGSSYCNSTTISNIGDLELKPKSSSGILHVGNASRVSIEERAFFNLKEFMLKNVSDALILQDEALKSKGSSFHPPESRIILHNITKIPRIPHNAFALSHSVLISSSNVTHIQEFAFGGISIQNVTFLDTKIRRLERHAFPDMTLIRHLHFLRCDLTSLSSESITSAISSLSVEDSKVTSISQRAFQVHAAAQVRFLRNRLPLKSRSLVFKTWSHMEFSGNDFQFLEGEAFLGISHPVQEKSRFIFSNNRIRYANRGALKFHDFHNTTLPEFSGNVFDQTCECFYPSWLRNVVAKEELNEVFLNESSCRLSEKDVSCRSFSSLTPNILAYLEEACGSSQEEKDPCNNPWILLRERFRPDRDQGILLILLATATLMSIILIIYSFFRWIFFLFYSPEESSKEDEWNFTQIEPLKPPETPSSGLNHYDAPGEPLVPPDSQAEEEELKSNKRKSIVVPGPTLTFYDEMIGFIKEKLDDPENYATVSDHNAGDTYMDPFDGKD